MIFKSNSMGKWLFMWTQTITWKLDFDRNLFHMISVSHKLISCFDLCLQRGRVKCEQEICPKLSCSNQTTPTGSCCPVCANQLGLSYNYNDWWLKTIKSMSRLSYIRIIRHKHLINERMLFRRRQEVSFGGQSMAPISAPIRLW